MADSVEAICNMALGFAGVTAWITSIDGKQASAQACKVYYAEYRDDLLTEFKWDFATRRQVLTALVGVTRSGWAYAAALPDDFLEMDELMPYAAPGVNSYNAISPPYQGRQLRADERVPYAIEDAQDGTGNQLLLMDLPQATAIYTAAIDNPRSHTKAFDKALAWALSVPLCLALRSDPAAAQRLEAKAVREINNAVAKTMRRKQEDPEPKSEFEASRE
jgi:hypothetical protein